MVRLPGQMELDLPMLERPRFIVHAEAPDGRTMESKPFNTEYEAQGYKTLLKSVNPTLVIKIKTIDK